MINGEFSSAYHYCLIDTVYTFKCCCDITQVLKRATEYQVTRLFLLWVIRFWVYNNTWNNIVVTIVGASFNEGRDGVLWRDLPIFKIYWQNVLHT